MGKILLTSDWHLTSNPRDEYRHQWQSELRQLVMDHNIESTLILGDLCEEKDLHPASLVNRVVDHLVMLTEYCKVTVLMGNHDYAQVGNPFWSFLNAIPDLNFCNQIEEWADDRVLFLPHTRDWKKDWAHLDLKSYELIFAHNTFEGADAGHGHKLSGIPTNIFASDTRVYAGDIHLPQTFGPVTYIGAPYTINFGDSYEPRVMILGGETLYDSIPCKGPQKMVVEADYVNGTLELTKNDPETLIPGDIVQVRVFLHREDYPLWHEIVQEAHAWGEEKGVTIFQVRPEVVDGKVGTAKNRRTTSARSDKQVFQEYTKRMKVDEETVAAGERLL